jgi:hypothetical protein
MGHRGRNPTDALYMQPRGNEGGVAVAVEAAIYAMPAAAAVPHRTPRRLPPPRQTMIRPVVASVRAHLPIFERMVRRS